MGRIDFSQFQKPSTEQPKKETAPKTIQKKKTPNVYNRGVLGFLNKNASIPLGVNSAITKSGTVPARLFGSLIGSLIQGPSGKTREEARKFVKDAYTGPSLAEEATNVQARAEVKGKAPKALGPVVAIGGQLAEAFGDPINLALGYGTQLKNGAKATSVADSFFTPSQNKTEAGKATPKMLNAAKEQVAKQVEFHAPEFAETVRKVNVSNADNIADAENRVLAALRKVKAPQSAIDDTSSYFRTFEQIREQPIALAEGLTNTKTGLPAGTPKPGVRLPPPNPLTKAAEEAGPLVEKAPGKINLERVAASPAEKLRIRAGEQYFKNQLEKITGTPITEEEVKAFASATDEIGRGFTREEQLAISGKALRTRQQLIAAATNEPQTAAEIKQFVDLITRDASTASLGGRLQRFRQIIAEPKGTNVKTSMFEELVKLGKTQDEIAKAAEGVDFNDYNQAVKFWRTLVKPKIGDLVKEYQYINLLSSPQTHIVNSFTNIGQAGIMKPAQIITEGLVDAVRAGITGTQRTRFAREAIPYTQGVLKGISSGVREAIKVLAGSKKIEAPDLERIPTNVPVLRQLSIIPRALEAGDVLMRTIIKNGVQDALELRLTKLGKEIDPVKISEQAEKEAERLLFRAELDPKNKTGQGVLSSLLDQLTSGLLKGRESTGFIGRFYVPFVKTIAQITKQGAELTPGLGALDLIKSSDKTSVIAKQIIGTTIATSIASLAAADKIELTWAVPTGEKEKKAFYDAKLQPYSIYFKGPDGKKTGIQYSRLGPLAYPVAMVASWKYFTEEKPNAITKPMIENIANAFSGTAQFFTDQTAVRGLDNMLNFFTGAPGGLRELVTTPARQFIPLVSLQSWVNRLMDPIYRQPGKELNLKSIIDTLQKDIIGQSKNVPPATELSGQPSKRQFPVLNAFSPANVSQPIPQKEVLLKYIQAQSRLNAIKSAATDIVNDKSLSDEEKRQKLLELIQRVQGRLGNLPLK